MSMNVRRACIVAINMASVTTLSEITHAAASHLTLEMDTTAQVSNTHGLPVDFTIWYIGMRQELLGLHIFYS